MFTSIIDTTTTLTLQMGAIITGCSLLFGLVIALVYMSNGKYSKSYVMTLVLLPAIIQAVIMLVNGNVGTGIAIMGAFSLIRFRSQPASAKEVMAIFIGLAVGLSDALGCITFSLFITVIFCLVFFVMQHTSFGDQKPGVRRLKVTIPENLDYTDIFDDIFKEYAKYATLEKVKTTNMGSMFELSYMLELKDPMTEKKFIDALRTRNGNLTIIFSRDLMNPEAL